MTHGSASVTIRATPEQVWPWVAELELHAQWSPKPYDVELVSGPPGAVGSTYRSVGWIPGDKHHTNQVEITEAVPAQRFALRATDEAGTFRNSFELRPVEGGTEVTFQLVFPTMRGMGALLVPVLFPVVGMKDIRKRMSLLKDKVEGTP